MVFNRDSGKLSRQGAASVHCVRSWVFGRRMNRCAGSALLFLLALLGGAAPRAEDTLQATIRLQTEMGEEAAASQARIDQAFEATQEMLEEYSATVRELDRLRRYNAHLQRMIAAQEASIAALETDLVEVKITRAEIVPLMLRMVEALEQFVRLDVPFLRAERTERMAQLRQYVDDPRAAIAQKYQRIIEAFRVEIDYGRSVEAYRGALELGGARRAVEFLRVGRVTWVYRSLDAGDAGVWDRQARRWRRLPRGHRRALEKAFRVARKELAPDLVKVPVFAPESAL